MTKNALKILLNEIIKEADETALGLGRDALIDQALTQIESALSNPEFYIFAGSMCERITNEAFISLQTSGVPSTGLATIPSVPPIVRDFADKAATKCVRSAQISDPKVDFILKSSLRKVFNFIANAAMQEFPVKMLFFYQYNLEACPLAVFENGNIIDMVDEEEGLGDLLYDGKKRTVIFKQTMIGLEEAKQDFASQLLLNFGWWFTYSSVDIDKIRNKTDINKSAGADLWRGADQNIWSQYNDIPRYKN